VGAQLLHRGGSSPSHQRTPLHAIPLSSKPGNSSPKPRPAFASNLLTVSLAAASREFRKRRR
jgi:hypothetical protein